MLSQLIFKRNCKSSRLRNIKSCFINFFEQKTFFKLQQKTDLSKKRTYQLLVFLLSNFNLPIGNNERHDLHMIR